MATQRVCHFEVWQSKKDNYWYWHLRDTNGKVVADGAEAYTRREGAVAGIQNVCSCCPTGVITTIADPN
jgi:uncharacterized protein YegP (UPF0339 family)